MSHRKSHWLSPEEQVNDLKLKGVKFDICDEVQAAQYMRETNTYFRLRSYRTNFARRVGGDEDGLYVNLDFAMLQDLAIIDLYLRNQLLILAIDIEHFSKMRLLSIMEANGEDGYEIIKDFISSCDEVKADGTVRNRVIEEIHRGEASPYTSGLIRNRPGDGYAAWEFVELISFGTLLQLMRFCVDRYGGRRSKVGRHMMNDYYLLQSVKGLRNACAHNNCILNDLRSGTPTHEPRRTVQNALSRIGIGERARTSKMSNDRLQQIATTFYVHHKITSQGIRDGRAESLAAFNERVKKHSNYYDADNPVSTGLSFITSIIDGWYGLAEESNTKH